MAAKINFDKNIASGVVSKIRSIWFKHKLLVISILVSVLFVWIGISSISKSMAAVAEAERSMYDVSNQIDQVKSGSKKEEVIVRHIDYGLNTERWQQDDRAILAFLLPAFKWSDANDYIKNRELYVQKLGENDPFVVDFMPSYTPKYVPQKDDTDEVDDGTSMSCALSESNGFKTYVVKIDETTGVYSYVFIVNASAVIPAAYSDMYKGAMPISTNPFRPMPVGFSVVGVCDVTPEGDVSNFKVFMLT